MLVNKNGTEFFEYTSKMSQEAQPPFHCTEEIKSKLVRCGVSILL